MMVFVSVNTSANLSLDTPPTYCCNCGSKAPVEFIETPLKRTRYFMLAGTELTLNESFPYCKRCKSSASRLPQGIFSQILVACMITALFFMVLVFASPSLPNSLGNHLFATALAPSCALTFAYFYLYAKPRNGRSYYQPVRLTDVEIGDQQITHVALEFFNPKYAKIFANANAAAIAAGFLRVTAKR